VRSWSVGDHLTHRFNPELGTGRITAVNGRVLIVEFPKTGATLRLAAASDALVPGAAQTHERDRSLLDRLARGDVDDAEDFRIRLEVLRLLATREAGGLGSFLGGRIRLFPHQLYVAERATATMPVRWLLADEVGLGKTIEAALILNRLVHTTTIERCLVVAPEALTVQWLGELWRKYHQVFTLLDSARLADVARDFGAGFNPFDVHRRAVIALETLIERPELTDQAVKAGIELLVVDEAQRLRRPPRHPGEPGYRAIAPIAALGRHMLLLSATPLEDDAHGFFRLLQLLRPDEFPADMDFEARLASGVPLPACTSATRRVDIGGLPPRTPSAVTPDEPAAWKRVRELETAVRAASAANQVAERRKLDRIRRALASGAALAAVLAPPFDSRSGRPDPSTHPGSPRAQSRGEHSRGADEQALRQQAQAADAVDPRLQWLLTHARRWSRASEKTLVFVAHRETLEMLRTALSDRAQLASGAFHEEMPAARRDLEIARFRAEDGPSILVSTEAGGEGRNFEFCHRLVLYDLPWNPSTVEQRIGRLDRIGRRIPVEIIYFRPPAGIGADVARLFERLGLFREPIAGLEPQLAHVEGVIEETALDAQASLSDERIEQVVADAQEARTRIRAAAYQQLHRDPYRADMAPSILARVPADLDALMESVVTRAASRLGFRVEHVRGREHAIEFGNEALIDSLPGVSGGASFVGSFDREYAVENETVDFFASGHPLVEGLLAHYEEDQKGRVAFLEITLAGRAGAGMAVIYKDGPSCEVVALDAGGRARPEWADALLRPGLRVRRMKNATIEGHDWDALVRDLRGRLDPTRRPYAVAAIAVTKA
jgi:ATP-dependent helicase HepA